jgi:signal transduction histidine kinase
VLSRSGVRVRAAATAALVVGLAMVVAGFALVLLLDRALRSSAASEAEFLAGQVAVQLAGGSSPAAALRDTAAPLALVQVLGGDGALLATTPALAGRQSLVADRPAPDIESLVEVGGSATDIEDTLVVAARGVATPAGNRVVLVGESLRQAARSAETTRNLLLLGVPVLVLVAGLATYLASGSALRPVERMRTLVADLTDRDLSQRVPVPRVRDEVGRLAVTMNAMLARLQAGQAAQRRFIADASHELRSPLATIVAGLELTRGREARDTARLVAMRDDAARLGGLVEDLLLLARADERGLQPRDDEVDLDELLYAEQLRLRAVTTVRVSVEVTAVRVLGDPDQLTRAVRNVVDNAVRHSAGQIELRLAPGPGGAVLQVGDDGPGIPPDDRERVFDRFVRLDPGRGRAMGGAGLGLAIVAEVMAAHGGRVEIGESRLGGASVELWLPVRVDAPDPRT